ncbi:helix-turn-helix transcriptional regulator [Streptomyces sp. NPDC051173]|uniref:helix-turn-helix domain-containing protein n=1 Tax=Streptomyces sp. NPDC051173 TaxID=3155164 RepID=UPI00344ECEA3
MFRLRVDLLRDVARKKGDCSGYAIARRTEISESSVYRILSGTTQPDLNSMLRIHEAYGVHVEDLMERVKVRI